MISPNPMVAVEPHLTALISSLEADQGLQPDNQATTSPSIPQINEFICKGNYPRAIIGLTRLLDGPISPISMHLITVCIALMENILYRAHYELNFNIISANSLPNLDMIWEDSPIFDR